MQISRNGQQRNKRGKRTSTHENPPCFPFIALVFVWCSATQNVLASPDDDAAVPEPLPHPSCVGTRWELALVFSCRWLPWPTRAPPIQSHAPPANVAGPWQPLGWGFGRLFGSPCRPPSRSGYHTKNTHALLPAPPTHPPIPTTHTTGSPPPYPLRRSSTRIHGKRLVHVRRQPLSPPCLCADPSLPEPPPRLHTIPCEPTGCRYKGPCLPAALSAVTLGKARPLCPHVG